MSKSHRVYITNEEANYLDIDINPSGCYRLSIENHIKVLKYRAEGDKGEKRTKAINKLKKKYGIDLAPKEVKSVETTTDSDTVPNDYEQAPFVLSAYCEKENRILSVEEYCAKYNQPFENVSSYKFLPHHYKFPTYNIVFKEQYNDGIDTDSIMDILKKELKKTYTYTQSYFSRDKEAVLKWADLHFGAHIRNLIKTKDYDSDILMRSLFKSVSEVNNFGFKKVHVHINGDLIESFSGMNHVNSWMSMNKNEVGANAVKLCTELLDRALKEIKNLGKVLIVAGNHDRTSKANDEDVQGNAANLIAWGLQLMGYEVEFSPMVTVQKVDGINHINLHGDKGVSKNSTEKIILDYGIQGMFNFVFEAHLHSIIEKLSVNQRKSFRTIKDDQTEYRRMHLPSFFTGNYYSESLGYYSNAGYVIVWDNGEGLPQMFFGSI